MGKIKIAVIGSCVSRDSFNSLFIKNYKDFYECVFHQNQMSMISLVSQPIPFESSQIDGPLTPHDKRQFETELNKSAYAHLLVNQPDYLILDFYADVLMGVRELANSYITNKRWKFVQTTLYKELKEGNELSIDKNPENYFKLWKESVDSFFKFMNEKLPNCKIVVNQARFTDIYRDAKTNKFEKINDKINPIDVEFYNKWWAKFDEYVIQHHLVKTITYKNKYFAVDDHPWGLFHLHFQKEFYEDFTHQLLAIIVSDLKEKFDNLNLIENKIETPNLILNPSFTLGKSYWSEWNDDFIVKPLDLDVQNTCVNINRSGLTKNKIAALWSNLIEIHANECKKFTLSFDLKISDLGKFDSHQAFFAIRTFNKTNQFSQKDAIWYRYFELDDIAISENKWTHVTFSLNPFDGNYVRMGPYVFQNGNVSWKNIEFSLKSM